METILDECLRRMTAEGLRPESLLALYPRQAAELRPLLEAAMQARAASTVVPAPGFAARARSRLLDQIGSGPRMKSRRTGSPWQLAIAISSLALFVLGSTTAFAQASMPGEVLYGWKLGSEVIWRTLSTDRVGVDLGLAARRTNEMSTVASDPARAARAREGLHEVLSRLESETDPQNGPTIDRALRVHQVQLGKEGIHDEKLDDMLKSTVP
jgi:hypothetical protein